jgi:TRAP-type mannitol/chloroaromatic compound transport system permease small subunit
VLRVDQSHHEFVLEHQNGLMNRRVLANLHDDDRDLDHLVLKTDLMKKRKKWTDAKMVDLLKVAYFYLPFKTPSLFIYFSFYEFSLREIKKGHS